jgi:hypothetical protein
MIVPEPQVLLTGDRTGLLERLHGLVVNRHPTRDEQHTGEFTVAEGVVERLEPIQLLSNRLRNPWRPWPDDALYILREEP